MNQHIDFKELKPITYQAEYGCRTLTVNARIQRMKYAQRQKMVHLPELTPHNGVYAIVGGAPSIKDHIDQIKAIRSNIHNCVSTLNGAHEYLIKNGVTPNIHILFEPDIYEPEDSLGGPAHQDVYYYMCSHCHPQLFKALKRHNKVLWHVFYDSPKYQQYVNELFPNEFMVHGGYMTFFRTLTIGVILGYRQFELFGCDASFEKYGQSHYNGYHNRPTEEVINVVAGTPTIYREFTTIPSLSFLANEFMQFCYVNHGGLRIRVHGDGLMSYLHKMEYPENYERIQT